MEWTRAKSKEKWPLLHDRKGTRYGIMGTKIVDLNNSHVFKGISFLALTGMVEVTTFQPMLHCFVNASVATEKAIGFPSMNFLELVSLPRINVKMQKVQVHQVIPAPMYRVFLWGKKIKC